MPKVKKLSHKRYTRVRVYRDGRKEVYNNDTGSWLPYAAIAYLLGSADKSTVTDCHASYATPDVQSGGGEGGGGGASSSWDTDASSSSDDSGSSSGDCGSSDSGGSCGD